MHMGFSDLGNVSNRNNRRLQHAPARMHWDVSRLGRREHSRSTDAKWVPPGPPTVVDRFGQVLSLLALLVILGLLAYASFAE